MKRVREADVRSSPDLAASGLSLLPQLVGDVNVSGPIALVAGEKVVAHECNVRLFVDNNATCGGDAGDLFITTECVWPELAFFLFNRPSHQLAPFIYRASSNTIVPTLLSKTRRRIAWFPPPPADGLSVGYRALALHAVCTDAAMYKEPCIFCQIIPNECKDIDRPDAETGVAASDPVSEKRSRPSIVDGKIADPLTTTAVSLAVATELLLVPAAATSLPALFSAMSACANRHPEPSEAMDSTDGEVMFSAFDGGSLSMLAPSAKFASGDEMAGVDAGGSAMSTFGEGGWFGDPQVLASLGLPVAVTDNAAVPNSTTLSPK